MFRQAFAALVAIVALSMTAVAKDPVPQVRTQAPGYYRMILGDFEITTVSDGTLPLDVSGMMTNTTPEEVRSFFERSREPLPTDVSINTFLVNTGANLVLIDAGAGALLGGKSSGRLVANLKASGYRPEQIDAVLITHIHGDHSAGLTVDGKPVFPEAIVHVHARERDYWLSSTEADRAPEKKKAASRQAHAALDPYIEKGRLKTFDGEALLYPGIRTWPHPGHTPGHTYYVVESKAQKLVLLGDTVHATQVQFPRPDIAMRFDFDSAAAADQRQKIFADAALKGYWLGAAHISFPGLGHIRRDGQGYAWIPATYRLTD